MAAKILVSFKEKEIDLYEMVKNQGDQSNFVKDALKFYLQNRDKKNITSDKPEASKDEIMNILQI